MKRIVTLLFVLCSMSAAVFADGPEDVTLTVGVIQDDPMGNDYPRSPIEAPSASIDDHTFYIDEVHPDYVFQLVDVDDEENVIYEVPMASGVNSIVIPSAYVGNYRVQLIWGYWCFWGYICL